MKFWMKKARRDREQRAQIGPRKGTRIHHHEAERREDEERSNFGPSLRRGSAPRLHGFTLGAWRESLFQRLRVRGSLATRLRRDMEGTWPDVRHTRAIGGTTGKGAWTKPEGARAVWETSIKACLQSLDLKPSEKWRKGVLMLRDTESLARTAR